MKHRKTEYTGTAQKKTLPACDAAGGWREFFVVVSTLFVYGYKCNLLTSAKYTNMCNSALYPKMKYRPYLLSKKPLAKSNMIRST